MSMDEHNENFKRLLVKPLSEIERLKIRAAAILRRENCNEVDDIQLEIDKLRLLLDFTSHETDEDLHILISEVLSQYILNKDPFPNMSSLRKRKRGGVRKELNEKEVIYVLSVTNSINKTANLFNVDRLTIKKQLSDQGFIEEIKGGIDTPRLRVYRKVFREEFETFALKWKDKLGGI